MTLNSAADQSQPKRSPVLSRNKTANFDHSPLITPERLNADPEEAFNLLPKCVRFSELIGDEVVMSLGSTPDDFYKFSLGSGALFLELCRVGFYPAGNSNGVQPRPSTYLKLIPEGAYQDTVVFLRVVANAKEGEGVRSYVRKGDQSPENVLFAEHRRASRDARALVLSHAERLVAEGVGTGRLPHDFDVSAYVGNLHALLARIDVEMVGETNAT